MSEQRCSFCRAQFPAAQIFMLDGKAVCVGCKPAVLARVLSGAPEPLEPVGLGERIMGFWETVGVGWKVIRTEWLALLLLGLFIAAPLNWLLHRVPFPDNPSMRDVARNWRLQQFGQTFFGVLATLGTAWITRERLEGRPASFGGALRHAVSRWLSGIGTAWLEGIFLVVLTLLLLVPGVIFAGYYAFSMIAVSLRGCGGTRALDYSKWLVKGRWGRVVGYALGYFLPGLLLMVVMSVATEFLPPVPHLELVTDVITDLAIGLATVFMTVFFLNLDTVQRAREATGETSILDRRLGQNLGR